MKVLLAGYEGSKKIIPASSWLIDKYLPKDFDVQFLNYGSYDGPLFRGQYVALDDVQHGGVRAWARYLADYIEKNIPDRRLILTADDYFLKEPLNMKTFNRLMELMDKGYDCARLCTSDFYPQGERTFIEDGIFEVHGGSEYACAVQYCVWEREALLNVLRQTTTPWSFELEGSKLVGKVLCTEVPAMDYPDGSCLSLTWAGKVKIGRANPKDIDVLVSLGYLNKEEFI